MSERTDPPVALLAAIRSDLSPVRPPRSFAVRAGAVTVVALLCGAVLIAAIGLRNDLPGLPLGLLAAHIAVRVLAAVLLIAIAMREGVPSMAWPRPFAWSVAGLGVLLLAVLPAQFSAAVAASNGVSPLHPACFALVIVTAIPATLTAVWLLRRAYPIHPRFACAAAAFGTALLAEALLFAACPIPAAGHGIVVHGGGVASVAAAGLLAGWLALAQRTERLREGFWRYS